jgi:hypothetical protein
MSILDINYYNFVNSDPLPEGEGEEPGWDDGHLGW